MNKNKENLPKKPSNVQVGVRREKIDEIARTMSGEACRVLTKLMATLKRDGVNISSSRQDIIATDPTAIDAIDKGLNELLENNIIKENKNSSEVSYSFNLDVFPLIFVEN